MPHIDAVTAGPNGSKMSMDSNSSPRTHGCVFCVGKENLQERGREGLWITWCSESQSLQRGGMAGGGGMWAVGNRGQEWILPSPF